MSTLQSAILLFAFGFFIDVAWCGCVRSVSAGHKWWASITTMMLAALSIVSVWEIIRGDSWILLGSYVLGQGIGAFVATAWGRKS